MAGTYAVIGDPIEHSMSPLIHNAAFKELGMDSSYIAYRIERGDLEDGAKKCPHSSLTLQYHTRLMPRLHGLQA